MSELWTAREVQSDAVELILSFEEISEITRALRAIPYVRSYAERVARASMGVIDKITREISEKERRITELELRLEILQAGLPHWRSLEDV